MANSLTEAAQNASSYSAPVKKECKFCGKDGLLILPLRCATLPLQAGAPALPAEVGGKLKSVAITKSSYTLRMGRTGYLYMLVNRKGALSWQCYIGTPSGYWAQFAASAPPLEPPEFTCEPNTCGINASMIAIHEAADVATAYLLFTPSPLTEAMLSEKQLKSITKAEELCSKGQMVKFSPASWVTGTYKQPNCLDAAGVGTHLAEYAVYNDSKHPLSSPLAKAMLGATFPLMTKGDEPVSESVAKAAAVPHLVRLGPLKNYMFEKKAVAVAMYDNIGIAQELNDFRNDALNKVEDFLAAPDAEKISNRWKYQTLQAIQEVKSGFENGVVSDVMGREASSELFIIARHEPCFPDDPEELHNYKYFPGHYAETYEQGRAAWDKQFPEKAKARDAEVARFRAEQPKRIARAKEAAKLHWEHKYAPLLDPDAMSKVETAFANAGKAAMELAATRVDDHLAWVKHDLFVSAFDVYDRNHDANGLHFEGQAALCTFGMVACEKSATQVEAWLTATDIKRDNIYMRGLLLNQQAIEKEAATALANAAEVAASAHSVAMIPGDKMYKAVKGLIDLFRKADSAWDEFVRDKDGQAPGWHKKPGGAVMFKMSEMNRAVFRGGITKLEMNIVGRTAGLVFSRFGGLAHKLVFEELVYRIDPQSPHPDTPLSKAKPARSPNNVPTTTTNVPARPEVNPERAAQTGKQVAQQIDPTLRKLMTNAQAQHQSRLQGVTYTAEEYIKDNKTNNYHQARIGVLLGVMETLALGSKLLEMRHGNVSKIQMLEASANLMSVVSIGYDTAYALCKSVREQAQDTAIKGAGDIARGGFKMWAGAFGAVAGGLGVWADIAKWREETHGNNRFDKQLLLVMRISVGIANTTLSASAAFSYSGPMLRRVEIALAETALKRRAALAAAATAAEWLAARVLLLRLVAWGSGAGWLLTIGEIGYGVYLYFQPNELEIWCKRCALRNKSLGGNPYFGVEFEQEEYAKARKLVQG